MFWIMLFYETSSECIQNLRAVDLYRYDEAWELEPRESLSQFASIAQSEGPRAVLIDLRKPEDFSKSHIPGSCNLPLQSCNASTPSPFFNAAVLEKQWSELEATFTLDRISAHDLAGKQVYVVCYQGDTARVATSVLRAKGITASSVKGGMAAVRKDMPQLQTAEPGEEFAQQGRSTVPDIVAKELRAESLSHQVHIQTGVVI